MTSGQRNQRRRERAARIFRLVIMEGLTLKVASTRSGVSLESVRTMLREHYRRQYPCGPAGLTIRALREWWKKETAP